MSQSAPMSFPNIEQFVNVDIPLQTTVTEEGDVPYNPYVNQHNHFEHSNANLPLSETYDQVAATHQTNQNNNNFYNDNAPLEHCNVNEDGANAIRYTPQQVENSNNQYYNNNLAESHGNTAPWENAGINHNFNYDSMMEESMSSFESDNHQISSDSKSVEIELDFDSNNDSEYVLADEYELYKGEDLSYDDW